MASQLNSFKIQAAKYYMKRNSRISFSLFKSNLNEYVRHIHSLERDLHRK